MVDPLPLVRRSDDPNVAAVVEDAFPLGKELLQRFAVERIVVDVIARAFCRARRQSCRIRSLVPPTCGALRSEIVVAMNCAPAALASVRASSVFPVPGGPYNNSPRGAAGCCA